MSIKSSELLNFYYDDLYPELLELEKERKKIAKSVVLVALVVGGGALFVIFEYYEANFDMLMQGGIVSFALVSFAAGWLMSGYKRRFKRNIFAKIVAKIDPNLNYDPHGMMPKALFVSSGLFESRIDFYEGNDLIRGKIGEVPIEFSDLKVEKEVRDSKGRKYRSTIFAGTFIITEFHKNFSKEVFVYPDVAEKYLGVAGGWLQGVLSQKLVRMDSPKFEKEFKVVAEDPVEAHYLLTPNIMEKLVELRKRADAPIYLSFRLNKLYIAISNGGNWFEPTIFKSLLSMDTFKSYIENINLILGIVEELNLNRRIWSKE